ncbi:response regulator transcription factor [Phenylobacterium zucineum]|uniref:response regulator transcription factor n=1 Tax=Phenylobacterium zucineum TaxID=284016 RepID=UPI000A04291D|nr:helix-turn-helix transcriptional regulator [Phenylobacterium zucineum]
MTSAIGDRAERPAHPERDRIAAALSARQLECLTWAQEGKSATDIGQILGISGRTVEGHLAKACSVLGVRTRVQAVVRARRLGLLPESLSERLS